MSLKIGDIISVPVQFKPDIENYNLGRHEVKIYVGYHGPNRKDSYISKETFEDMAKSLRGSPIVGDWDDKTKDFKSHGETVVIESDGIKYEKNTHAYGYIDSQADIYWEDVKDGAFSVKEYLVTTGYLWVDYFEEAKKVLEGNSNQSMEIKINDGYYDEEHGRFNITDATFRALCILGENVEPAFEDAKIIPKGENSTQSYSLFELASEHNRIKKEKIKLYAKKEELEMKEEIIKLEAELKSKEENIAKLEFEKKELEENFEEAKANLELLTSEKENFESKVKELKEQKASLEEYKANKEREEKTKSVNDVLDEFNAKALVENDIMSEEDYSLFVEKAIDEMEIIDLKKELSFMFVENKLNFSFDDGININPRKIEKQEDNKGSVYGSLEKYIR